MVVLIAGGWWAAKLIWFTPFNINHFYERAFIEFALKNPELLTTLRILEPMGLDFHNDDLNNASDAFQQEMNELVRNDLRILQSYDRSKQSPAQLLSTEILEWFLDDMIKGQEFQYHDYPVNQLSGEQSNLPTFMATMHVIEKQKDAENYITRLSKFGVKFDQVLEGLRIREQKGIIPPAFVIDKVLIEMKDFAGSKTRDNILFTSFHEKVSKLSGIDDSEKEELFNSVEQQISETVYPAYGRFIAYFESLKPKSTTDDGVWKLPDGDRLYNYMLRHHTTTTMTADEIHALGLKEVERIEKEMTALLEQAGYTGKTVYEHVENLSADPQFLFPDSDEGRKECLLEYQKIIDEIEAGISFAFDIRPKVGVKVERIPQFKEKTSPGAYYDSPSFDGTRPGIFFANLRDMKEITKWGMRTLSYHEAIPGHHFQIAIQQELQGVPMFRKVVPFTAYSEGWALYTERLAWEHGFQKEPLNNLGRLQAEMMRAVRLVVDTGIHRKRWTREYAIDYMLEKTGMAKGDVVAEIERYIVSPGQACAYKMGQLKILELREKAKQALGDRFDLRKFHNVVLVNGAMPLEILEKQVQKYIAEPM